MIYTSDALLLAIKRKATMPASQTRFSDADLLAFADEALQEDVIPMLVGARQEFMVYREDLALVGSESRYQIPRRALGRQVRDATLTVNGTTRRLEYIEPERFNLYPNPGTPRGFAFEGDRMVFLPTPDRAYTVSLAYHFRPPHLVKLNTCGVVVGIGSGTVTLAAAVSTVTSGTMVDFVSAKSGNAVLGYDKSAANVAGAAITFGSPDDVPSNIEVGDYVCVAGTAPVPAFVPEEAHPLLATIVAGKVLEAQGDLEALGSLRQREKAERENVLGLLVPRSIGSNRRIIASHPLLGRSRRTPRFMF